MRKHYSRLTSLEEKKNIRRAFLYGTMTILSLGFLLYFGLPTMARLAGFLGEIKKGETPVIKNDNTPPAPPRLNTLPDATNQTSIDVDGTTEPGATVFVYVNHDTLEVLANNEGDFSMTAQLNDGENIISAKVVDPSGNEGQKTQTYTVLFDNEEPILEISSPSDGASFFGEKQKQITIKGQTESGGTLTINDRIISVSGDDSFTSSYTLSDGENILNFKGFDKAGNLTEKNVTVNFTP